MYKQEISTHFFKFAQTDGVTVRLREVKAKDFNYRVEGDDEFIQYYYSNLNDENSSVVFVAEPINSFIPGWVIDEGRINVIQDIKNLKKPITINELGRIRDENDESRGENDRRGESKTNGDFLIKKYEGLVKAAEKYEFAFTCKNKDLLNILKHYAKKSYVSICYYDKTSVEINGEKLQIIDTKFGAKFTDTSKLRTAYQDYCTYLNDYISHFVSNIPQSHILGITYFTNGLITIEDITAIKDGCTYQLIVAPIMGSDQLSNYHDELKRLSKSRKIISIGKSDIPKTAEKPQQKEEVKEMTAKKTNTYGDLNSVKKEIERIYSQIGALEKERAKWDKMGDKKRVKYYDDLIKDNEHKIKTFQKVISDVEKMEKKTKKTPAKKTSAKKTSGTPRTKGLHQTGTQTLEGRKMDLKIKAELPGKRTSATGKTYYEYRVNRTDMPAERLDFDKNFHRVYARDDPKLSSLSDIKQEIKTQKHSLEFYKEKREHCKRFDAKDEVKKFDKWIGQTKDRLEVLEKELKERKEKKTAAKKTPAKTPAKASSGTSKKTAEAIKAELYSTRSMLIQDKHELMRLRELLYINDVEKTKWERMGDKRRVKYYDDLIKENKAEILKYETKVIPALEKEISKLEKEKKELETKKTSGTPAKKKASGTASAKPSAKKKQVKSRKTSKTQKTLF